MFLRKQFKTYCDLGKISRSPDARNIVCARVIYSLNSGRCTTHCFRYAGKNRYYLAHICQFKNCVTLKIQANSFTIHYLLWGIFISLKFVSLNPNLTLKNRSGSYKLNQLLIVYTHISLARIHQLVQKKPGTQMSVMPMQMLM